MSHRGVSRGDDLEDDVLDEIIEEEEEIERQIPLLYPCGRDDFVIEENQIYAVSILREFFKTKKI